ncbi:MAG: alpha-E domain-containing protein, partial [Clostridia bacterium]|nr:alpha-E domain-containing protein [Deltaproteobacteria bacterium]
MALGEKNASSIKACVAFARENARSIREVVSLEFWETLNELYLWLSSASGRHDFAINRYGFYRRIREAVQLCLGVMRNTMLHDAAFNFISLGLLLERCGQTARILDVQHHILTQLATHDVVETALWLSLLRACSGHEPFMKSNRGALVSPIAVASFLVLEPAFPRSVRYCLKHAYDRLVAVRPQGATDLPGGATLERLRVLEQWLAVQTPAGLAPSDIHDLLTHIVDEAAAICDGIATELFSVQRVQSQSQSQSGDGQSQSQSQSQTSGSQSQSQRR